MREMKMPNYPKITSRKIKYNSPSGIKKGSINN